MQRSVEQRRAVRFPAMFLTTISSKDRFLGEGTIQNISATGCRVERLINGPMPIEPGTELVLRFYPSESATRIEVERAQVRWTQPDAFGVHFLSFQPGDHTALDGLIGTFPAPAPPLG